MAKKIIPVLVTLSLLYFSACKKDNTPAVCAPTDDTQTYTAKVKPILDANCVSSGCHDATGSGGVTLTTYDGALNATKNGTLISQIQSGAMPQLALPLSATDINTIIAWKDNCYQQ